MRHPSVSSMIGSAGRPGHEWMFAAEMPIITNGSNKKDSTSDIQRYDWILEIVSDFSSSSSFSFWYSCTSSVLRNLIFTLTKLLSMCPLLLLVVVLLLQSYGTPDEISSWTKDLLKYAAAFSRSNFLSFVFGAAADGVSLLLPCDRSELSNLAQGICDQTHTTYHRVFPHT